MVANIAIKGGLGNQLFQYALGNYLHQRYKAAVFYDTLPLTGEEENLTKRVFLLDTLFSDISFTSSAIHNLFYGLQDAPLLKWYKKIMRRIRRYVYIAETDPARLTLQNTGTYYFDGYWQQAELAKLLTNKINARTDAVLKNNAYASKMQAGGETVAMHIRRGDYVNNAFINNYHGHCDLAYYQRAMAHMEEKMPVASYFIFSDDIAWAKQNISSSKPLVFVEGHDNEPATDLFLMKSCRHQIIANSSFSCWAAYLNTNPQKIIIAPVNWTRKEKTSALPLFDNTWQLL